ncbi:MAG: FAD-dependent oxidoreductase [Proteobacteria bacterium]|nr:FAD-dependent oxidoreductase [Pseudomonadota bacterium]
MVYLGAFETPDACRKWKNEFDLPFPVVSDAQGGLFQKLTTGWVPCSILVGSDGKVVFWETEFDEAGFSTAIENLYRKQEQAEPEPVSAKRSIQRTGPSEAATIVILGGGAGGIVAAHHLRRSLSKSHRIVVIDRSSDHLFASSLLWLMVGARQQEKIRRPLERLAAKGIEFHQGEVAEIDLVDRQVQTDTQRFDYDYLIVTLGAELAPHTVPGFDEIAYNLYDPKGCEQIHAALEKFEGGTVGVFVSSMPFKCPAAPYEAALLVDAYLRQKGVRDKSEIHLFTPEHQPMPMTGTELGKAITEMLGAHGIHYHPLFTFEKLRPETREIVSSDGSSQQVDLLIGVPPHHAPDVVRSAGLLGVSGWIHVDQNTLRTPHDGVFAIGDITNIRLHNGKTLPMAGVFAHYQAKVVAQQISSEIRGRSSAASFDGKGSCWIELGDGKAGFASGNFYADPDPQVRLYRPGRLWHWAKVAFEKWWLYHWF